MERKGSRWDGSSDKKHSAEEHYSLQERRQDLPAERRKHQAERQRMPMEERRNPKEATT